MIPPPAQVLEACCRAAPKRCFWVAGVQVSYLSALLHPGDPDILEHLVPPGAGPPFYLHECRTDAFYVVQGQFRFRCGANDTVATPGQFLTLPPGLPHLYENTGEEWGRLLNVISPGGLEPLYAELDQASHHSPLDFQLFLEITSRHGVAILNSRATPMPKDFRLIVEPEKRTE